MTKATAPDSDPAERRLIQELLRLADEFAQRLRLRPGQFQLHLDACAVAENSLAGHYFAHGRLWAGRLSWPSPPADGGNRSYEIAVQGESAVRYRSVDAPDMETALGAARRAHPGERVLSVRETGSTYSDDWMTAARHYRSLRPARESRLKISSLEDSFHNQAQSEESSQRTTSADGTKSSNP